MAKNTILQSLNDSDNVADLNSSNRRQVQTFIAGAAIAAGDAVALDLSESNDSDKALKVVKCDTAAQFIFVGVALEAASAAGDSIRICISGLCECKVDSSCAANSLLIASVSGGKLVHSVDKKAAQLCAIGTEAKGSETLATVFVIRQGY
jgi:hypothetical protein|tara:strand:+ start:453 stop:902 length:450 start_codon:yes stop_codon:yes gene_type:complete